MLQCTESHQMLLLAPLWLKEKQLLDKSVLGEAIIEIHIKDIKTIFLCALATDIF